MIYATGFLDIRIDTNSYELNESVIIHQFPESFLTMETTPTVRVSSIHTFVHTVLYILFTYVSILISDKLHLLYRCSKFE